MEQRITREMMESLPQSDRIELRQKRDFIYTSFNGGNLQYMTFLVFSFCFGFLLIVLTTSQFDKGIGFNLLSDDLPKVISLSIVILIIGGILDYAEIHLKKKKMRELELEYFKSIRKQK